MGGTCIDLRENIHIKVRQTKNIEKRKTDFVNTMHLWIKNKTDLA